MQLPLYNHLFIHYKMKPAPNFHKNWGAPAFSEFLAAAFPICVSLFPRTVIPLCNRSGSLEQLLLVLTAFWLMAETAQSPLVCWGRLHRAFLSLFLAQPLPLWKSIHHSSHLAGKFKLLPSEKKKKKKITPAQQKQYCWMYEDKMQQGL